MYCTQCGNPVREGNKFCAKCGAGVELPLQESPEQETSKQEPSNQDMPSKKRKRKVLPLILGVCVLALLVVSVIAAWPILFPGKETVYLLTEQILYAPDGSVSEHCTLEYDEGGRLVRVNTDLLDGETQFQCRMKYDEYGNRVREVYQYVANYSEAFVTGDTRYDFSYDEDGRVEECEISYASSEDEILCEFSYDEEGNLILVEWSSKNNRYKGPLWQYYKYNDAGKLTAEYFCTLTQYPNGEWSSSVLQKTYKYGKDGNLTKVALSNAQADEKISQKDLDELEFEKGPYQYSFDYDSDGRLTEINDNDYEYDKDGNLDMEGFVFDEYGNLICDEDADGSRTEYTYEAVTLSRKDAQTARRQKRCLPQNFMNITHLFSLDPTMVYQYPLLLKNEMFYNYMIPHPIW